jgi:hypothetical protein
MARNIPGGSTVTRGFPASLTGGPAVDTSKWTVEYEVDFTDLGTHNFLTTATKSIKSVTWTSVNRTSTDADVFDLHATGLRINAKANLGGDANNGGKWYDNSQSQPYIWATLDDMITSTALAEDDTLCLQLEMTTTSDVSKNYMRYGLGLWKDDAPGGADNFIVVSRFYADAAYSAGIAKTRQDNLGGGSLPPQPNFFEIVSYPGGSQVLSSGVISGDFPDPLATTAYRAYNAINHLGPGDSGGSHGSPSWNIPYDKAAFVITCQVQSADTALNSTSAKMRVLRRKKS